MNSLCIFDSTIISPIVTIAIPTYQRAELLIEAVESAIKQVNFDKEYEILVSDNNPNRGDATEQLMERYRSNPKISYHKSQKNIGMIGNWNRLFFLAKGRYVVILLDDDLLFPYYLQFVFSLLEGTKQKYEFVYPSHYFSDSRIIPSYPIPKYVRYRKMTIEDYLTTQWGLPSGLMIKKDKFLKTCGYKNNFFPISDIVFIYESLHYVKGAVIQFPMCLYYKGVNTSMNPDVIKQSIIQGALFYKVINKDKTNKLRWMIPLCQRALIIKQAKWGARFVSGSVIDESRKEANLEKNWIKDKLSILFSSIFLLYAHLFKTHKFRIEKQ